jgi:hypothetical protein
VKRKRSQTIIEAQVKMLSLEYQTKDKVESVADAEANSRESERMSVCDIDIQLLVYAK